MRFLRSKSNFESTLDEYLPMIKRAVFGYVQVSEDRDELLQEVLLTLWKAQNVFRGDSTLKTFVYRVVHNRCLQYVIQKNKIPPRINFDEVLHTDLQQETSESILLEKLDRTVLSRAVASLPIALMQIVTMYLEGLNHQEIAATIGISENAVAIRLNRAKKYLETTIGGK